MTNLKMLLRNRFILRALWPCLTGNTVTLYYNMGSKDLTIIRHYTVTLSDINPSLDPSYKAGR
jgi:hypothetical protein